ncbi:MAG: manganese efflux pump MntP family protein [Clostridia bacterium]|nr:manganese efflux pump MntP family protein [Clostridia bacterium]
MTVGILLSVILSGVSLAMDAFAVSICDGMVYRNLNKRKGVLIPLTFGVFQAIMPIIGFYVGLAFSRIDVFDEFDHWIAFALLFIIGAKMVYDGAKELRAKEEEPKIKEFSFLEVLVQGVATSIDALFVGFSLNSMLEGVSNVQLWAWISVCIIGVVTFAISLVGLIAGVNFGKLFKKKASIAEMVGGVVLIGIGLKILIEGLI